VPQVIDTNAQLQHTALSQGALEAVFAAQSEHGHDPVVTRAFAEAVGGMCVANNHVEIEDVSEAARRICKAMTQDFHDIEPLKDHFPTVFDEVHGRDEFVTAYGAKSLGRCRMCGCASAGERVRGADRKILDDACETCSWTASDSGFLE